MKTKKKFIVEGPEGIPISRAPFATRTAAQAAIPAFVERFRQQGYYSTVKHEHIPLELIAQCCSIVPVDPDE